VPFAKAPHVKGQVHYAVCSGGGRRELLAALRTELQALAAADPNERETTLLIVPDQLADFLDFNDVLDDAEALLDELGLAGVLQIAPFHPRFQFAGTEAGDITNATNRSPYPTLHLLREASVDRAVEAFPEAEAIYEANMATLEKLGPRAGPRWTWGRPKHEPGCSQKRADRAHPVRASGPNQSENPVLAELRPASRWSC
jgi:hypothetical protein